MPPKNSANSADAYQIKVTLQGSKPPIWRRFVVPGAITLASLHDVLQEVMGWYDGHLHGFVIDDESYTAKSRDGIDLDMDGRDERRFRLHDVVRGAKAKFHYEYDFGDGWEHVLLVEKTIPAAEKSPIYTCLAGKGRCPPEDCGGIWGYYHLLRTLGDPKAPNHAEMLEWAGGAIDPDEFDMEAVNRSLARFRGGK